MSVRIVPLVVAVLVLLLPLLASGGESAQESEFVGAAQCGTCHQAEYEAWTRTPHAQSLEKLSPAEQKDARCRQCHTTAPDEVDPALSGVQCEACHGRGRYYSPRWVMKDRELRDRMYFERGGPGTCTRCHTDTTPRLRPFIYDEAMRALAHGRPASADGGTPGGEP